MQALDLMYEAAALAGYTIDSTTQGQLNKTRALRRLNVVKADVVSRYGGKWPRMYKEGWLALKPLAPCLATFTNASYQVPIAVDTSNNPLSNTLFSSGPQSYMVGAKILGPDGAYYRIAAIDNVASGGNTGNVYLDTPYQGATAAQGGTTIWNDEYTLFPAVQNVAGFVEYNLVKTMREGWPANFKESYPKPVASGFPSVYEMIGNNRVSFQYSTGTVSGTINTNTLTGAGTSWKANIQPGTAITIGNYTYHVKLVNSDTQITLHQFLQITIASGTTYTAIGKNAPIIRFNYPTVQEVVHYWYWEKDYPFVADADEDWIAELYPRVLVNGLSYFDYLDKNDVARGFNAHQVYEDSIKNMKVASEGGYTGVRTIGLYIPPEARE